ncbi:hypothetical protein NDS46_08510 [Paenibacillus thiaminolyticus]|nr:hypothetical protein [Paenibacillus thiaminolyticus]WCF09880.1 hypothetical protein NDS46_08510 [Paenibacillus thiaminolyticus]
MTRHPDKLPSLALMLQDLFEVIQYLKRQYHMPKIVLFGHSCEWQAPFIIAEKYFAEISAPDKNLYIIPGAGHSLMMDQPQLCFEALADIHGKGEQRH